MIPDQNGYMALLLGYEAAKFVQYLIGPFPQNDMYTTHA